MRVAIRIAISLLFSLPLLSQAALCTFTPPEKWEFINTDKLPARVKIGCIGPDKNGFRPSLNLAIEEGVGGTIEEYLRSVKALYGKERENRWRDLGAFQTLAGPARLTSVDIKTKNGEARLLQLILLQDRTAYILTAVSRKEEFSELQKTFERAFCSLHLSDDRLESQETEP